MSPTAGRVRAVLASTMLVAACVEHDNPPTARFRSEVVRTALGADLPAVFTVEFTVDETTADPDDLSVEISTEEHGWDEPLEVDAAFWCEPADACDPPSPARDQVLRAGKPTNFWINCPALDDRKTASAPASLTCTFELDAPVALPSGAFIEWSASAVLNYEDLGVPVDASFEVRPSSG